MTTPDVIAESATARLVRMPARDYHADPGETPTLSASIAKRIVNESPLHAWLKHPRLGGLPDEPTTAMERGTIIHALVLGTPLGIDIVFADNYRTKAAQERRDAIREAGFVPVLEREIDGFRRVADAISHELLRADVFLGGDSEAVALWTEDTPAGPVACRGMLDHVILTPARAVVLDLKTCDSAHPQACAAHVLKYGYDIQRAAYVSAVEKVRPDLAGRVDFVWAFAEELPGPRVALTVARADGSMREIGGRKWARACETWARCLASGEWPGYATGGVELAAPNWALVEEAMV